MHAYFHRADAGPSTLEAVVYEMPFGLAFRKAVLWHDGKEHKFGSLLDRRRDPAGLAWSFGCSNKDGCRLEAAIDGTASNIHRIPYLKTDCSGNFEVTNNSLARATLRLEQRGRPVETLETTNGAVLEMVG